MRWPRPTAARNAARPSGRWGDGRVARPPPPASPATGLTLNAFARRRSPEVPGVALEVDELKVTRTFNHLSLGRRPLFAVSASLMYNENPDFGRILLVTQRFINADVWNERHVGVTSKPAHEPWATGDARPTRVARPPACNAQHSTINVEPNPRARMVRTSTLSVER